MKTWDQIALCVGHLDLKTKRRCICFMRKNKRATVESITVEFRLWVSYPAGHGFFAAEAGIEHLGSDALPGS